MTSFLPIIGMVVSILAQMRSSHNGVLQLMISLIMWIVGCKRKVSITERKREKVALQYQNIDNNVANQIDKYWKHVNRTQMPSPRVTV